MSFDIKTPVGLDAFVHEVRKICEEEAYRKCGVSPPHFIVSLDEGNGRTMLVEYLAESFYVAKVRHFGGLDLYLEYTVDGTMDQLRKIFTEIRTSAVYTNEYEGVVAMDITELSEHINEIQMRYFLKEIRRVSQNATLLLFVPTKCSRNIVNLVKKIRGKINEVSVIQIEPYSSESLADITKCLVEEAGVRIPQDSRIDELLRDIVTSRGISSVRESKKLSETMLRYAVFSRSVPILGYDELVEMFTSESTKGKENSYESK